MAVELKIPTRKGLTLHTKKKFIEDDIDVTLDDSLIPQGTITITENGEYDVSNYETANVNTPVPTGTLEVTENGEHDVASYEKVNVNVASSGGDDMLQARVDSINSCNNLFYEYQGESVDYISKLNTSNVTKMVNMFYNCNKITSIPLIDTSNVTTMQQMFYGCYSLTSIPTLDTSNVTNMSNMFRRCSALKTIPQLDTSNVTNMDYMFNGCSNLTTIPLLNTSNVINMSYMFSECKALTTIPQLDTSNVDNTEKMFYKCRVLTSVPQLNTSKLTKIINMFESCDKLKIIDITCYKVSTASNSNYFLYSCTALKALIIRSFGTSYELSTSSFKSSSIANGTGYIYVPRNMVDTLKSATNWSTYADQIRALEDYTLDGTTTGELDLAKMGLE